MLAARRSLTDIGILYSIVITNLIYFQGLYITKTLRDTIEAAEAGLLAPGTGPESRLTNDQWLALKEEVCCLCV